MQKTRRQWKDRNKVVEMVLFPCYIFAHLPFIQRYDILTIPSVVSIVTLGRQPTPVRDEEIESIQRVLETAPLCEVCERSQVGEKVEFSAVPLKGLRGDLVSFHGNERLAINIDAIAKSLMFYVDKRFFRRAIVNTKHALINF